MKTKTTLTIRVIGAASLIACFAVPHVLGMAVVDAGANKTLKEIKLDTVHLVTILGHVSSIDTTTQEIKKDTGVIKTETEKIRAETEVIRQDTAIMREIGEARQAITMQLAKLTQLADKGFVLDEDPFVEALTTSGVPSLYETVSGGGTVDDIMRELGDWQHTPEDLAGRYAITGVDSAQMVEKGLDDLDGAPVNVYHNDTDTLATPDIMASPVQDAFVSLLGLSWNGYRFTGKGASFHEALISHRGTPIGLDTVPPVTITSIDDSERETIRPLLGLLHNHVRENYRLASAAGQNPWQVAPGLFLRPKTDADRLFEEMVLSPSATAGSKTAFYAAAAVYSKSQYHPLWGFSAKGDLPLPVNVNNMLSRGAYQAIANYNKEEDLPQEENPYARFGKYIAPVIAEVVDRTPPGQNLVIRKSDLLKADEAEALSLNGETRKVDWEKLFADSAAQEAEFIRATTLSSTAPTTDLMIVSGLTPAQTQEHSAKIMANSARVSQNNQAMLITVLLLRYNQEALEKIRNLEMALHNLATTAGEKGIIESIPMMIDSAQNTGLVLQNRIGQLMVQVESLLGDRDQILAAREDIQRGFQSKVDEAAPGHRHWLNVEAQRIAAGGSTAPM